MIDRLRFLLNRIKERLWVRPLLMCLFSTAAVLIAKAIGYSDAFRKAPEITVDSLLTLLSILSASMLVIATFAVGSMVASYASAAGTATPRTFPLVLSDDVSQNALSIFIGAFIFSIVGIIAVKNGYYLAAGRFVLFILTVTVFGLVIMTFVWWVDRIARLGRLGATIDKVEAVAATALSRRRSRPTFGCHRLKADRPDGLSIRGRTIGYVQRIDVGALQSHAKASRCSIRVEALPGTFATPDRALAYVIPDFEGAGEIDAKRIENAFVIGNDRTFDDDPRFGLIVLSEIGSRALSPAVNDPGTAIDIVGTLVRLLALWIEPPATQTEPAPDYDRVEMPELLTRDLFDDAFTGIARDGAGAVEVVSRLLKALHSLAAMGDSSVREAALHHARVALSRAEKAMTLPADVETVRSLAAFAVTGD